VFSAIQAAVGPVVTLMQSSVLLAIGSTVTPARVMPACARITSQTRALIGDGTRKPPAVVVPSDNARFSEVEALAFLRHYSTRQSVV
jgi:hypothetical protein